MYLAIFMSNELEYQCGGVGKQLGEPVVLQKDMKVDLSLRKYNMLVHSTLLITHIEIQSLNPTRSVSPKKNHYH